MLTKLLKTLLVSCLLIYSSVSCAQKLDSIFVNLYTDSLKKGTYNYINIVGKLSNGQYAPLDSSDVIFWSTDGKFTGNSLWIDKDFIKPNVLIKVIARKKPLLSKEFTMYIKRNPDNEQLKTADEMMNNNSSGSRKRKRR